MGALHRAERQRESDFAIARRSKGGCVVLATLRTLFRIVLNLLPNPQIVWVCPRAARLLAEI